MSSHKWKFIFHLHKSSTKIEEIGKRGGFNGKETLLDCKTAYEGE